MFWGDSKNINKAFKDIEIAICTLLIHAARTDENYTENEKNLIKECLNKLGIKDQVYMNKLFNYCEVEEHNTIEILNITKEIKKLEYKYRLEIVEMMLKIIYFDKKLCHLEDRLIRKVAGLIYIEYKDLGNLKKKIRNDIHS